MLNTIRTRRIILLCGTIAIWAAWIISKLSDDFYFWNIALVGVALASLCALMQTIESLRQGNANSCHSSHYMSLYSINMLIVFVILSYAILYHEYGITLNQRPDTFSTYLYFSVVTLTTLGYGDVQPADSTMLLAASQALIGYVLMSIYVALIWKVIQKPSANDSHLGK